MLFLDELLCFRQPSHCYPTLQCFAVDQSVPLCAIYCTEILLAQYHLFLEMLGFRQGAPLAIHTWHWKIYLVHLHPPLHTYSQLHLHMFIAGSALVGSCVRSHHVLLLVKGQPDPRVTSLGMAGKPLEAFPLTDHALWAVGPYFHLPCLDVAII